MVDDVRYKPDFNRTTGTGGLLTTPEMFGLVELVAYEAIPFARAVSPDALPYGVGYVDKFSVSIGTERIARSKRAVAYLSNDADYAAAVEYGPNGQTGHHVLAKTLDHIEGII